ncbi:MAG TPA: Crp/Fnr family transcriptional regulator, partial [Sphingomicrobium sp.]|nr:Crp/Fnr family transcriptional regulator [Sphingomicrobium sp.]
MNGSNRLDAAFSGNLLLATFSAEVRALLDAGAEVVDLDIGQHVQSRGQDVAWSYFPFGTTMISLVVELSDGRSVQVASIGREGAVGGIVSCGHAPAFAEAKVIVAGPAIRVTMKALEEAKSRSSFLGNLFCRFSDYLLAEVMQSATCNSFHSIQQRAARWLLTAQDRAGDRIELTQEALAELLGVQ